MRLTSDHIERGEPFWWMCNCVFPRPQKTYFIEESGVKYMQGAQCHVCRCGPWEGQRITNQAAKDWFTKEQEELAAIEKDMAYRRRAQARIAGIIAHADRNATLPEATAEYMDYLKAASKEVGDQMRSFTAKHGPAGGGMKPKLVREEPARITHEAQEPEGDFDPFEDEPQEATHADAG